MTIIFSFMACQQCTVAPGFQRKENLCAAITLVNCFLRKQKNPTGFPPQTPPCLLLTPPRTSQRCKAREGREEEERTRGEEAKHEIADDGDGDDDEPDDADDDKEIDPFFFFACAAKE